MSEETKALFAEIFGEQNPAPSETPKEVTEATPTETPTEAPTEVPEVVEAESVNEKKADAEPTESNTAENPEKENPKEKSADKKSESTASEPFPKKDLGVGGAAFCDEILKHATPDILTKLKSGEKTMAGCWNWVYSHVENEYIKSNGRVSGGMWMDCSKLVERYFAEIPEGTVEGRVKPKMPTPASTKPIDTAKAIATVKKVAKKAAKAAKKSAKAKKNDSPKVEKKNTPADIENTKKAMANLDFSCLMEMMK